jgi:hypothetical protein
LIEGSNDGIKHDSRVPHAEHAISILNNIGSARLHVRSSVGVGNGPFLDCTPPTAEFEQAHFLEIISDLMHLRRCDRPPKDSLGEALVLPQETTALDVP